MDVFDCSIARILYPSLFNFLITAAVDRKRFHGTYFSAPSATLAISLFGRLNLSRGAGVIPHKKTFSNPAASTVRKMDPTLWPLRILWSIAIIKNIAQH